jgi:hypothetical protein
VRRHIQMGILTGLLMACSGDGGSTQHAPQVAADVVTADGDVAGDLMGEVTADGNADTAPPKEPFLDDIWLGVGVTADGTDVFAQGHHPTFELYLDEALVTSLEHEWNQTVEGHVWIDGRPVFGVGVTQIKVGKEFPNIHEKERLHLAFDHVDPLQTFQGYRGLQLHAMSKDGSKLAEVLGYELFRGAGVPAPRATHAWLEFNGVDRGLYALVEPMGDPKLVSRHDPDPKTPVYRSAGKVDIVGDQLETFILVHGEDEDHGAFAAFAAALDAIDAEPPEDMPAALDAIVDLNAYLTFAATEVILGHRTGYAHGRVRFGLIQSSTDGRWGFIPQGLDRSLKGGVHPLSAEGRIHKLCMSSLACRWMLVDAYETVAEKVEALGLVDKVDAARPFILAMVEADPFIEDVGAVAGAINGAEDFLSTNPGWVLANLDCVDPTFVDKDGDGYSGCGDDCNDENPDQHPGADEVCNLFDDNCDGAPDNHEDCDPCVEFQSGWGKHYDLCFDKKHYQPAREHCQLGGGDLAIVDDPIKQEVLVSAVVDIWWTDWWIGLDDLAEEGVYVWVDGTPLEWSAWADNEPNNSGNEDCNHFAHWASGNWNDIPCDRDLAYICEYDD